MCKEIVDFFTKLFQKKETSSGTGTVVVVGTVTNPQPDNYQLQTSADPLTLPHPEEPRNDSATMENVNVPAVVEKWLTDWQVPAEYWEYWKTQITITLKYPLIVGGREVPACAYGSGGRRYLEVEPQWLNAGVIAHEQAHNSYALLTAEQRAQFEEASAPLMQTDEYIKLLFSKNVYGLSSVVEGHAEVYRYIGEKMPDELKQFYPKLF